MRNFILAFVLLASVGCLAQAVPAASALDPCFSNTAKSSAFISVSTATTTQVVALSAGKTVYVCAFIVDPTSGTTPTAQFVYGTGASCGTGTTALSPAFSLGGSGAYIMLGPGHTIFSGASGNALCVTSTGTTPTFGVLVTFVQS